MEGKTKQTALVGSRINEWRNVQKRFVSNDAVEQDTNAPNFFNDKDAIAAIVSVGNRYGCFKSCGDSLQFNGKLIYWHGRWRCSAGGRRGKYNDADQSNKQGGN